MLKAIDTHLTQGTYLNFRDEGYIKPGAKTRKFTVTEREGGATLGVVRWYSPWRKYCFYTNNIILEEMCLNDISEFIVHATAWHKMKWKD